MSAQLLDILNELGVNSEEEKIAQRNALREKIIKSISYNPLFPLSLPILKKTISVPILSNTSKKKLYQHLHDDLELLSAPSDDNNRNIPSSIININKNRSSQHERAKTIALLKLRFLENNELLNFGNEKYKASAKDKNESRNTHHDSNLYNGIEDGMIPFT